MTRAKAAPAAIVPAGDQAAALVAMVEGRPLADVASAAGVPVAQLLAWLSTDAPFVAALNARRQVEYDQQAARLQALRKRALDVVETLLDTGDGRLKLSAAALVLRAVSEAPRPAGPASPQAVQDTWDEAEQLAERDRRLRELLAGM